MHVHRKMAAVLGSIAGVAVLVAAALGGRALAQTPSPSPTPSSSRSQMFQQHQQQTQQQAQQFLNALATNLNISPATLQTAVQNTENQQIAAAVSSGQITQTEANDLQQHLANGGSIAMFAGTQGMISRAGHSIPSNVRQAMQTAFSQALGGQTPQQIGQALHSGQTLSQIAQAHGTTLQAIQTAMVNAAQPVLAQDAQQGQITAAQEQSILNRLQNSGNNGSGPGFGFGGFFGGFGHGGFTGPASTATPVP